jgi:hypothetical protein
VSGEIVASLESNANRPAGWHALQFNPDAGQAASGFYLVVLETGQSRKVEKLILTD